MKKIILLVICILGILGITASLISLILNTQLSPIQFLITFIIHVFGYAAWWYNLYMISKISRS